MTRKWFVLTLKSGTSWYYVLWKTEMLPSPIVLGGHLVMVFPCTPACRSWSKLLLEEIPSPWQGTLCCHQPHKQRQKQIWSRCNTTKFCWLGNIKSSNWAGNSWILPCFSKDYEYSRLDQLTFSTPCPAYPGAMSRRWHSNGWWASTMVFPTEHRLMCFSKQKISVVREGRASPWGFSIWSDVN